MHLTVHRRNQVQNDRRNAAATRTWLAALRVSLLVGSAATLTACASSNEPLAEGATSPSLGNTITRGSAASTIEGGAAGSTVGVLPRTPLPSNVNDERDQE